MIKVLIIDNEAIFLDYLESAIKAKGHKAFTAKDIVEAILVLQREEPHLVFLDLLFLSTPSGQLFFKKMKGNAKKRKIYLTCGSYTIGEELSKRIGADGVILKPFQKVEIAKLIDKICQELK